MICLPDRVVEEYLKTNSMMMTTTLMMLRVKTRMEMKDSEKGGLQAVTGAVVNWEKQTSEASEQKAWQQMEAEATGL
jgi:hypothetical protein